MKQLKKGSIVWIELGEPRIPGLIGKTRPCVVFSNKSACKHSPVIQAIPLTTCDKSAHPIPIHLELNEIPGTLKKSTILCEQITTVPKSAILGMPFHQLNEDEINLLNRAVAIQLAM